MTNQTNQTATAPMTAADYLTSKDDGFPKEENGRIYADAYDLIGKEMVKATWNPNGMEVTILDIRTHSPHDGAKLAKPMVFCQLWATSIVPQWHSAENFRINGNRI